MRSQCFPLSLISPAVNHQATLMTRLSLYPPREVQAVARRKGLLCREAFHVGTLIGFVKHPLCGIPCTISEFGTNPRLYTPYPCALQYREHPLHKRLLALMQPPTTGGESGAAAATLHLGRIRRIDVRVLIPKWVFGLTNIRFMEGLAGGAMMDAGSYCAHVSRELAAAAGASDPLTVTSAAAKQCPPGSQTDGGWAAECSASRVVSGSQTDGGWAAGDLPRLLPLRWVGSRGPAPPVTSEVFAAMQVP